MCVIACPWEIVPPPPNWVEITLRYVHTYIHTYIALEKKKKGKKKKEKKEKK